MSFRTSRILGLVMLVAMVFAGSAVHAQATFKIGVFDPQRVSMESAQGKRLQSELSTLQAGKQAEIKSLDEALLAKEKEYSEQRLSLSEGRRKAMELDIERRRLELKNSQQLATQQLQLEYNEAQQNFNDMLIQAVAQFGEKEGFSLILDMSSVAWAAQNVDVTTAVIDLVDSLYPAIAAGVEGGGGN
jgi:outer membrane protein